MTDWKSHLHKRLLLRSVKLFPRLAAFEAKLLETDARGEWICLKHDGKDEWVDGADYEVVEVLPHARPVQEPTLVVQQPKPGR